MKFSSRLIIFIFTVLVLGASAYGQSPREQLQQMVEQLQKTPNDNALRERIIKLGAELKPAPAVSDEAIRYEGRGQFAFANAKSEADFLAAAREYEKAVAAAPWVQNYYSDLCKIYEKAGKFGDAKRHCGFYLSGLTDTAQMTDVKRRIAGLEFGIEQAASANAEAAAERLNKINNSPEKQNERLIASLNGARFACPDIPPPPGEGNPVMRPYLTIDNRSLIFHSEYIFPNGSTKVESPHRRMVLTELIPTLTETGPGNTYELVTTIKKISDREIAWVWKARYRTEGGSFTDWRTTELVCHRR